MKPGTVPAWQLLPGDRLELGLVVTDCETAGEGLVRVSLKRPDGTEYASQLARDMPFNVNQH